MAFTQSQLDALDEAIASGTLKVKYSDKEVEYRSLREMMQLRDFMARKLGQTSAAAARIYPTVSKGLNSE